MTVLLELVRLWHISRAYLLLAAGPLLLLFLLRFIWLRILRDRLIRKPQPLTSVENSVWPEKKTVTILSVTDTPDAAAPTRQDLTKEEPTSLQVISRPRLAPKRVQGSRVGKPSRLIVQADREASQFIRYQPLVFFFSLTGTTEVYARILVERLRPRTTEEFSTFLEPQLHDLSSIDYDDFFITPAKSSDTKSVVLYFYLLIVPTYNIDSLLNTFLEHLQETHNDFRIDTAPLSNLLGYSIFGFGDREGWPTEEDGFCLQAKEADKWMAKLSNRKRAFPIGMGDIKSDAADRFEEWSMGVEEAFHSVVDRGGLGEGAPGSGNAVESSEEDEEEEEMIPVLNAEVVPVTRKIKPPKTRISDIVGDLEDLGSRTPLGSHSTEAGNETRSPLAVDFATTSESKAPTPLKAMVPKDSPTYAALTKQGYSIIGSHSGVKICRWTKSALRGRGSCYKYSFYGIASHLCMETTPSLSCSNKCVFCWRHGTNPVGTTWRWQVDPPELIFAGAKAAHLQKIKMMRGVPGVRAERFQEAMQIKHCALSLVGEPIFYPYINQFLALLHAEHISSFLVCNAQHPDQLAALGPVTQLYVSIDASNRESLRKIDRPLHRDFWERFNRCLDILCEKRFAMRTVFRLTLVKGFNIVDEVAGYADLVARGLPCFVEIKGVTFCGTSTSVGAGLTMQNVPFYHEVVEFVEALNTALEERGLEYGIAAEHAHSCCVLLASNRFRVDERWHTLIDYEKFFECLESGSPFTPEDYMGPETPEWATWGRGGFDPRDERVDRKGRKIEAA